MVEEYKELGKPTALSLFYRKLADVTQKFAKLHKPFDEPCCILDFRDKLEAAEKESERIYGFVKDDIKIELNDLDKYADENRFEFVEDQEDVQDKVIEGSRTQVVIGHTLSYKCKPRGHGISVFIPIKEYNELGRLKIKEAKEK